MSVTDVLDPHRVNQAGTATPSSDPSRPPVGAEDEADRLRALRRMKAIATGLLVLAGVVFVVARRIDGTLAGYVEAFAEAAMVGALADWFAVTALFKHPLGLPIPHTAIIKERKDDIGRGLGTFVQGNFLSGPVVAERIRAIGVAERIASHLSDPANARRLSENASDAVRAGLEVLRDEDLGPVVDQMVRDRVAEVPAAALGAKVLEAALVEGHQQLVVDALLDASGGFLDRNIATIRARVQRESPWWVPESIDDRVVARLTNGARRFLAEVADDPDHEVRRQIDERARLLAERLRTSPELEARSEELKRQILEHPALRSWSGRLWTDLRALVLEQASDPDSELRKRLAEGIERLGQQLATDSELQAKVDGWVERTVLYVLDQYRGEVADLISGTVARWDAEDASRRIEVQVGRDLQFIRINGTIVGGLVGVVIHALTSVV